MNLYFGPVLPADYSPDDPDNDYRYGDYRPVELSPEDEVGAAMLAGVPLGQLLIEAQEDVAWAERDVARHNSLAARRALQRAREKLGLIEQALELGRAA